MPARFGEAVMCELSVWVLGFVVSLWAMAFVVVHEILARTRQASSFGTVRDVSANLVAIFDLLFETAVTFTVVVIDVLSNWLVVIHTPSIWATLVAFAIVFVFATFMLGLGTIGHTESLKLGATSTFAIDGVARIAIEESHVLENQCICWSKMLAICWHDDVSTLHGLAAFRSFVFAVGGAIQHKFAWTFRLTISCVASLASIRLLLREDSVHPWMHGFREVRRSSTLHRQENLFSTVLAIGFASEPEHSASIGPPSQGVAVIRIVVHLVLVVERSCGMSGVIQFERRATLDTQAVGVGCIITVGKACELILRICLQTALRN
jgi:hypothetical protein